MGFLGLFNSNSNEGKRNRRKAKQYGQQAKQQRGNIDSLLDGIVSASEGAYQDANQTVNDRYGETLQNIEDSANANTAAGNQAVSRGLMAGGGDITGEGAVAMGKNQERGNEAIQKALNYYTQRNESANRSDNRRGDRLTLNALGGREGLYQTDMGQEANYRGLERQRKQANNQFLGDLIGGVANVATLGLA